MDFSNEIMYVDLYEIYNSVYDMKLHEKWIQHQIIMIDISF